MAYHWNEITKNDTSYKYMEENIGEYRLHGLAGRELVNQCPAEELVYLCVI
jgi:hypothetical protein